MIGDIFYKILFYFLEIAFVENSGRSYPVFGISQSTLWTYEVLLRANCIERPAHAAACYGDGRW